METLKIIPALLYAIDAINFYNVDNLFFNKHVCYFINVLLF